MFDRFTQEAKDALSLAAKCATSNGAARLYPVHILVGCVRAEGSLAARILIACQASPHLVLERAERLAARRSDSPTAQGQVPFTPEAKKVLECALEVATELRHRVLGTHHLLLGIVRVGDEASAELASAGVTQELVRQHLVATHREAFKDDVWASVEADRRIGTLKEAQRICVDLQEFDVASKLRDIAHKLRLP